MAHHACAVWKEQQKGRITASKFHEVYTFRNLSHPNNLVKQVLGYENDDLSHIPAVRWGITNENTARKKYINIMSSKHNNFVCTLSGLWINPLYPHLGASPDGITRCDCCGEGILEIKCPFSAKEVHPDNLKSHTCAFITDTGHINHKHRYYTQVQGQLMITNKIFCDFFIWTPKGNKTIRIYHDVQFWEKLEKS